MRYLNAEDLKIASRFVFISMAIKVLEQDLTYIKNGSFRIKEPYVKLIKQMISSTIEERRILRKQMFDRDLRVTRLRQDDLFTTYLFICERKEEERTYFNPVIRQNVKDIMIDHLRSVLRQSSRQINHGEVDDGDNDVDRHMKA